MKKIAVIDFETDPFLYGRVPQPFAAGFYDGLQDVVFWGDDCVEKLYNFLIELDESYSIYVHNGGRFDVMFLLEYLEHDIKIINGRIAKCFIDSHEILDSFLILPLALKNYGKTEIDYAKFERNEREKNRYEITQYLRDDCKYLFQWVNKFINRFGKRFTLAGAAFATMKKQFNYTIEKTANEYDLLFRDFYAGGRVECFKVGVINKKLNYYDINSAYPFAMIHGHPFGDDFIQLTKLPKTAGGWFAKIDAVSKGCLPCRFNNKMNYFRDDVIRTYFATGWEIIAGLETNTLDIKKVHIVYKHAFTRNFKEYVEFFHKEKQAAKELGDKDTEIFSKLMLNAAYGRFGMNSRKFFDYKLLPINTPEQSGFVWECDILSLTMHKRREKDNDDLCEFYNVATAASITGFVRAFLWRAICHCSGFVYCDTDSLLCTEINISSVKNGAVLGDWKHEARINKAYIGGRKFYLLEGRDAVTGERVVKRATKGFRATDDELKESITNTTIIEYKKDAPAFSIKMGANFISRDILPVLSPEKNLINGSEKKKKKVAVKKKKDYSFISRRG